MTLDCLQCYIFIIINSFIYFTVQWQYCMFAHKWKQDVPISQWFRNPSNLKYNRNTLFKNVQHTGKCPPTESSAAAFWYTVWFIAHWPLNLVSQYAKHTFLQHVTPQCKCTLMQECSYPWSTSFLAIIGWRGSQWVIPAWSEVNCVLWRDTIFNPNRDFSCNMIKNSM